MNLWDPLALREISSLIREPVFRGRGVPPGDGRPVLLIPGFLSGDWLLRVLYDWLKRIGYRPYASGILFNVHHSERMLAGLRHRLIEVESEAGAWVSIVGHSRGGLLGKVLSERRPQSVEQVIALGSPLADWQDLATMTHHAVGVPAPVDRTGGRARKKPSRLCVWGRRDDWGQLMGYPPDRSVGVF